MTEDANDTYASPDIPRNHPGPIPMQDAINYVMERVERESEGRDSVYLPTGFSDLDKRYLIGPQTSTILFGAPGVGTSTLALDITRACAVKHAIPALHISWEMHPRESTQRMLAAESGVPIHHLRTGRMARDEDWTRVAAAMTRAGDAPLMWARGPRTVTGLRAMVSDWRAQHGDASRTLVVLDGLPLLARLTHNLERDQGVWEDHSRLSAEIKDMAGELDVATVSTVPVNRDHTRRVNPQLYLSDVAYSPAYVSDADTVIAVHRPDHWQYEDRPGEADLQVLKAKQAPTFQTTVAFQGHYARFHDMAH